MKSFIFNNRIYFISVLVCFLIAGYFFFLYSKEDITLWVNARYSDWLDSFILVMDKVGTIVFHVVALLVLWWWKGWKSALRGVVCIGGVLIVIGFFKYILFPGTPRPTLYFDEGTLRLLEGIIQLKTESFPSGHTAAAFCVASLFSFAVRRKPFQVLFVLLAALVGYGRIYLSQHFFVDVYFGMILSVITTIGIYFLMSRLLRIEP